MEANQTKQTESEERKREVHEKLITGQITIAEAMGISGEQLYEIAQRGYQLLTSGKLEEARQIYSGLIAANPFDSVFHCHLAAVLWKMGDTEQAFNEFDTSLKFNIANVDALAGRGELYLQKGEVKKGIEDLRKALENDPKGERQSTMRARALLLSLRQAAKNKAN